MAVSTISPKIHGFAPFGWGIFWRNAYFSTLRPYPALVALVLLQYRMMGSATVDFSKKHTHMHARLPLFLSCCLAFVLASSSFVTAQTIHNAHIDWAPVDAQHIAQRGERHIVPEKFNAVSVSLDEVRNVLEQAPLELVDGWRETGLIIPLPMPDGQTQDFRVWDAPIMATPMI